MRTATLSPRSFTVALLATLAIAASPAAGQGLHQELRDFEASGTYVLTVDGKRVADAEIYENTSLPAVLVIAPESPTAVVLRPGKATVETVPMMKVAKQPDGTVALFADAALEASGNFRVNGSSITFQHGGRPAALDPKPPLLGLHRGFDLTDHDPAYERGAESYRMSPTAVASLRTVDAPVTVRVLFGSWCPHCKLHVPAMLAVEEQLQGSKVAFEYFGLPAPPAAWKDPEAMRLKVSMVPTAIVYVNGKPVGRLAGGDWNAPEVELARLVKTFSATP